MCSTIIVQAVQFIAYIEEIAQFVLSRSFKQRFPNASLAQWAGLRIGPTRPLVQLPALFVFFSHFFAAQLLMYYDIAAYSVFLQHNDYTAIL